MSCEPPRLLTIKAAAEYLGVSAWAIRRLIWDGDLPALTLSGKKGRGARLLIDRHDLDRLVERRKRS